MKYIKKYNSETTFDIFYKDENETKYVVDGENSPKVIEWLSEGNQFEVIEFIPIPIEILKSQKINEFKSMAGSELSKTDYKIIRQYEYNTLPEIEFEALKAERQAIRDKCNLLEEQVLEWDNYESLININWQYE
jgi:hypothetical protein